MTHDDAVPHSPPPPDAPPARARPRRRWIVRTAVGLSALALLTAAGFYTLPRIVEMFGGRLAETLLEEAVIDEEVVAELKPVEPAQPPPRAGGDGEPVAGNGPPPPPAAAPNATFLVIGSDSREDLPAGLVNDRVPGRRADVIMLVTLEGERARVLSIPRDLQVEVEGYGAAKVNAAFAYGGSALMVSTITREFGIPINHYLEVDFFGFASIVNELGGVDISFPYRARDRKSFLDVPAGTETLNGEQALAYARSRNYQELRGDAWMTVDGSDLGRIRRQQTLLYAMLASLRRPTIIFDAWDVVRAAGRHLTLDANLDQDRILDLADAARRLNWEDVEVYTLPVSAFSSGGVFYLRRAEPEASRVLAAFTGVPWEEAPPETEPPEPPEPIAVRVLNGNGAGGQARIWGDFLEGRGFELVGVGDAADFGFERTVVTVRPGDLALGERVAAALGFGVVEAGSVREGTDAVVVVGADALAG